MHNRFSWILCFWMGLCCAGCSPTSTSANKDYRVGPDPDDPSVFYAPPFVQVRGYKTYNGTAYDKASVWIEDKTKVIIPEVKTKVVDDGEPNVLSVFIEKCVSHGSHHGQSEWPIPRARRNMGCAIKLYNGNLMIGTFGEFGYKEGSESMRLAIHVPKGSNVERRAGLAGSRTRRPESKPSPEEIEAAPQYGCPALTAKHEARPELWLAPTKEDGWHELPSVPDENRQAAREWEGQD